MPGFAVSDSAIARIVQRIAALELELTILRDQLARVERHLGIDRYIEA